MSPGSRPTSIPSSIVIHPAVWPQQTWAENWGAAVSLFWGGTGCPSNTIWPGPRPISVASGILIHPAVWPHQTWAENWGGAVPLFGGRELGPSNRMWPGPRPTSTRCFVLIHPTVWLQHQRHRQIDRTDRQGNGELVLIMFWATVLKKLSKSIHECQSYDKTK